MGEKERLFLWDIDGTLISVGGAGERAFVHAIQEVFGIKGSLDDIDYAGRTDRKIAHMLHEHYRVKKTDRSVNDLLESYLAHLETEMKSTRMHVLPGVLELLEDIEGRSGCHQGLLTGNLAKGAQIKLSHFNIWRYFPFGAYSNLSLDRNELSKFALIEAQRHTGYSFDPKHVYVIGDTPHDIECGKVIAANTVAVSTGRYSVAELRTCRPDFLFKELPTPGDFWSQVLS